MRTNFLFSILVLSALFFYSCAPKAALYLPVSTENFGNSPYGSYLEVDFKDKNYREKLKGELIAVQDSILIVRVHDKNLVYKTLVTVKIPYSEIKSFKLFFAQSRNYDGFAVGYSIFSLTHGWWSVLTIPLNLVTTLSIHSAEKKVNSYTQKEVGLEKLNLFARFPQGMPEGISIEQIK